MKKYEAELEEMGAIREKLSRDRDTMREHIRELEELLESFEDGFEDLDVALAHLHCAEDAMSQYV